MYKVSQGAWVGFGCVLACHGGYAERTLAQEGLGVGGHVCHVIHHHKHLDHSAVRVEQGDLNGASAGHVVAAPPQVYVPLEMRKNIIMLFQH